jgi:hypothetical protein
MASPLGLGFNETSMKKTKAELRYNSAKGKWVKNDNKLYENSMFGNGNIIAYFPTGSDPNKVSNMEREIASIDDSPHSGEMGFRSNTNSIYDVRTQAIIDWSQTQSDAIKLYAKDFAYLRYLGVYPNNRLIVCRKFKNGVDNDLSVIKEPPVATILSWAPPGQDILSISFGEKWVDVDETFTDIFNDVGKYLRLDKININLGEALEGGIGGVPLPGFTEIWQRKLLKKLGLIDDEGADIIPSGSPNLVKEAKRRKLVKEGEYSSGIDYTFSIEVTTEYEQKFIGGLDPTKAFYDIIANIAAFGTDNAVFFLNGAGNAAKKFSDTISLLRDNPKQAISNIIANIVSELNSLLNDIKKTFETKFFKSSGNNNDSGFVNAENNESEQKNIANDLIKKAIDGILLAIEGVVKKYEVRILGVVNMLTGNPSGTWHVTIGNPKRPIFSSGDMYCTRVTIDLGETLAFNDLPSTIKVKFTLQNSRPLGKQEIMSRFMQGVGRTYISGPSSWSEIGTGTDFTPPSPQEISQPSTDSITPVGGIENNGSQSDGTENFQPIESIESFTTGEGQESTNEKEVDPDDVRNIGNVTDSSILEDSDDPLDTNTNVKTGPNPIEDPNTKIYKVPGDPYQYKVVNGVWYTKGSRKDGTGNIPEWTSLENNQKAIDILNKRHPEAIA